MIAKLLKYKSSNPNFKEYVLYNDNIKLPIAKTGHGHGYLKLSLEQCEEIYNTYNDIEKLACYHCRLSYDLYKYVKELNLASSVDIYQHTNDFQLTYFIF